ncbi:MAG: PAS domain S-box protein, partial [Ignavibacteria bacterium]|nr:PAS domain S-box protein [Ignavibacteria bacterium]
MLTAVTEGTDDIIFVKDTYGKYMFVNSSISKITNHTTEEMIGKSDIELFPVEQAQKTREVDQKIITTGVGQTTESTIEFDGIPRTYMTS